jgi:aspartate/methionine/tyrosine aminotransferase
MRFSSRLPADLTTNRLTAALAAARAAGRPIIDLTESNPTRAGFDYPADLLAPLSAARGLVYAPEALGIASAREAVAADFARRGLTVAADRLVLTASTSEAYSFLFKLLCEPGDEVLVPVPSYPLFDHLTRLDAIRTVPYPLEHHGTWSIDFPRFESALSSRARAVLLVNPNNPTGSFVRPAEADRLAAICAGRGVAIISDEVFADYALAAGAAMSSGLLLDRRDVLGFTLGGLSKSIGLPQAKLAWMAVSGPDWEVRSAIAGLELVCDTYLSVATPVQLAAAELLARGAVVREQIARRIRLNDSALRERATDTPACRVLDADGGWYAVIQVPSIATEEEFVITLVERDGVLVHPGFFFDFPRESFVIVSLLPPPGAFAAGTNRLFRHFDCTGPAP